EVRCDLLGPREWCVERPTPRHRHVGISLVGAPGVVEVLELIFDRNINAIERGNLVRRADRCAFGTTAVVAGNVDDPRGVELAHGLDVLDHATDLVIDSRRSIITLACLPEPMSLERASSR